jgi:hypothetical protein
MNGVTEARKKWSVYSMLYRFGWAGLGGRSRGQPALGNRRVRSFVNSGEQDSPLVSADTDGLM